MWNIEEKNMAMTPAERSRKYRERKRAGLVGVVRSELPSCQQCNHHLIGKLSTARYCSGKCRMRAFRERVRAKEELNRVERRRKTMLLIDDADEAILGYVDTGKGPLAVYCYDKLVDHFARMFANGTQDAHEAAVEWISFNIEDAWLGDATPMILYPADRDRLDEIVDEHASED